MRSTASPGASVAQVARDLGISESGLRRWTSYDDVDAGRKEGLSDDERAELVRLRREVRVTRWRSRFQTRECLLRRGERAPNSRVPAAEREDGGVAARQVQGNFGHGLIINLEPRDN